MGSVTETTNKTGAMSARGLEYDSMLSGMIQANLADQGYDIKKEPKTVYKDPDKATMYQDKIATLNGQLADIDRQLAARTPEENERIRRFGTQDPLMQQRIKTQTMINDNQNRLDKIGKTTYDDYTITKLPDPRVQQAISQYGPDSQEAKTMQANVDREKAETATAMADVNKSFLKNLQKYSSGDYSYTPEQKAQIDTYFAPIRGVINDTANKLMVQVGDDDAVLGQKLNDISDQINKTGFEVSDALEAASIQVDKNKTSLLETLRAVNDSTEAKYKFQQDLMFQQVDKKAAQQAALLGLPPNSPLEQYQRAKMRVDASTQLALELNAREAQGALNIEAAAGEDKKKIQFSYVALAESQGAKQEDVKKAAFDLATQTFGKKEGILAGQQAALLDMEKSEQNTLMNAAFGGLPSLISTAQGGLGFQENMKSAQQQREIAGMAPVSTQLGVEQQRTFAENTQTTKTSPGFLDVFSGIVGTGAAAAGAVGSAFMKPAAPVTNNNLFV